MVRCPADKTVPASAFYNCYYNHCCPADKTVPASSFYNGYYNHCCPADKTVSALGKEIWYFNTTIIPRLIKVWIRSFFSWPRSAPSKEIRYFNTNTFPGPRPTLFQLAHFPIVTMTIVLSDHSFCWLEKRVPFSKTSFFNSVQNVVWKQ